MSPVRWMSFQGQAPYDVTRELQLQWVEKRIADQIPDTILMLEHPSTVTRGQGLQYTGEDRPRRMPLGALPPGTAYFETERGGDLTWHGPGQWVVYPIVKLADQDLGRFLRTLETGLIRTLGSLGIRAHRRERASGVWVGEQKVASMGIAVRKWVTFHGIALNCVNSWEGFSSITPCGFSPEVMCRVVDLITPEQKADFEAHWRERVENAWMESGVFDFADPSSFRKISLDEALRLD